MLINFSYLLQKYNFKPTGIFHIGASHGEEMEEYLKNGVVRQIWIEAIPEVFDKLQQKMEPYPWSKPINACISNEIGKTVEFNITNNDGQSSSFLPMKEHLTAHPDVKVINTIKLITTTADEIVKNNGFEIAQYDFLNIDLQGAELLALQGFVNNLNKINYIYIEVNEKELYEGCPHKAEIDAFLLHHGFEGVEESITSWGWGDKFYMRKKT
jgi:FkbM family methyltransferase